MTFTVFLASWFGLAALALAGWAAITAPARRAREARAHAEAEVRREAITAAMNRHPAGKDLHLPVVRDFEASLDDLEVKMFRAQIEQFEADRRASAANG